MTPRLSVLIPSHRPAMLHDAMGSVFNQTTKDVQLLVSYADASEVPYWPTKINELAAAAIGDYLAILCDDDILSPQYAATMLAATDGDRHGVVYSDYAKTHDRTAVLMPAMPWTLESFQNGGCNPLCGATFLVRRDLWRAVGGIDPAQTFWDWALAYALFRTGTTAAHVAQPLVVMREHEDHTAVDTRTAMAQLHHTYPELQRAA